MLPTPEQEKQAILALMGLALLVIFGAAALLGGIALAVIWAVKWVWGLA
jgi:hypothetical protein